MTAPRVTIVGIGVIGGSLARRLAGRGWEVRTLTPDAAEREAASARGLEASDVDEGSVAAAVGDASLIVIAVPISAMREIARQIVAAAPSDALIVHACSLHASDALGLDGALAARLLGTHPFTGSHEAGFAASNPALFERCTVTVEERASREDRRRLEQLWTDAGAGQFIYVRAESHDRVAAWTSHLPQLTATALAATIAAEVDDTSLSGPGVRDTTRLAMSPFTLWRPILSAAPTEASRALAALEATIREIREAVDARDTARLETIWRRGREWRNDLQGS